MCVSHRLLDALSSSKALRARRLVTALCCLIAGPVLRPDDYRPDPIPWFIYLTNWGFIPVLTYFSVLSAHHAMQLAKGVEKKDLTLHNTAHYNAVTKFMFHLGLTLQPFVVLGYWTLVFPVDTSCDWKCSYMHGFAFCLMFSELLLTDLPFDKNFLKPIIGVPLTWLGLQTLWIHAFKQPACYDVLPMNNVASAVLCVGALLFFLGTFSASVKLAAMRDKYRGVQRDSELELHWRSHNQLDVLSGVDVELEKDMEAMESNVMVVRREGGEQDSSSLL
jgi:hypothetical protein